MSIFEIYQRQIIEMLKFLKRQYPNFSLSSVNFLNSVPNVKCLNLEKGPMSNLVNYGQQI